MAINPISSVSTYLKSLGKAYVYAGNATVQGGLSLVGMTEGDIEVEESFQFNDLKAPEWTGDAIHDRWVDGQALSITVPFIWYDSTMYNITHPLGAKGGGRSAPVKVTPTSVFLISTAEVPSGGLSYNGTAYSPNTPPVHSFLLHRATPEPGRLQFKHGEGGKSIRPVTFRAMFDDTKPEGQKLYTVGDPVAAGITGFRL